MLLGALVSAGFGVAPLIASGAWELLAVGGSVRLGVLPAPEPDGLGREDAAGTGAALRARTPVVQARDTAPVVAASETTTGWTPIPVPKPLYLSHPPVIDPVMSDPAEELAAAAAAAERALRVAEASENVTPIRPASGAAPRLPLGRRRAGSPGWGSSTTPTVRSPTWTPCCVVVAP